MLTKKYLLILAATSKDFQHWSQAKFFTDTRVHYIKDATSLLGWHGNNVYYTELPGAFNNPNYAELKSLLGTHEIKRVEYENL